MTTIKLITRILLVVAMIDDIYCQIPGFGSCPRVDVVDHFDLSRYLGHWYEVKKYPSVFSLGGKCISSTLKLLPDGSVNFKKVQTFENREKLELGNGFLSNTGLGIFKVAYPDARLFKSAKYYVLDTDYQNYAVVFACRSMLSLVNAKIVWIMSRERYPPQFVLDRAYEVLRANDLSTALLVTTDNDSCSEDLDIRFNTVNNFRN